ncbi:uncharacterized protein LOC128957702 [Oppia nitens]|uniref:uncharacterized protein LOC128957702 n=1 Tax=Oppia nitens TaxID=1686743 RepID=UPI0023DC710E|nr:uncharacterized protein LOC128957702 [Oppia nitens]
MAKKTKFLPLLAMIIALTVSLVDGLYNWPEQPKTLNDMCKELKGQHRIVEAFHHQFDMYLILEDKESESTDPFGPRKRYYVLRRFNATDVVLGTSKSATFAQVIDMTRHWSNDIRGNWLFYLKHYFIFTEKKKNQFIKYLIGFNQTFMDTIEQYDAYRFPIDISNEKKLIDLKSAIKINTNIYKYIPQEDEYNLMTLVVKFPQEDINNRIHAITSLPTIRTVKYGRYYVYYMEKPRKSLNLEEGVFQFRRHLFEPQMVNYETYDEMDWAYIDNNNITEKCIIQNYVNASTVLNPNTGYVQNYGYMFQIIEFINNEFRIKKGSHNTSAVSNILEDIRNGSVLDLLKCTQTEPVITTTIVSETPVTGDSNVTETGITESPTTTQTNDITSESTTKPSGELTTKPSEEPTTKPSGEPTVESPEEPVDTIPPGPPPTEAEPTGSLPPEPEVPEPTEKEPTDLPMTDEPKEPEESESLLWLWILLILSIVIIIAFGVFYLLYIFVGPFNTFVRRYIINRDIPPSERPNRGTRDASHDIELKEIKGISQ